MGLRRSLFWPSGRFISSLCLVGVCQGGNRTLGPRDRTGALLSIPLHSLQCTVVLYILHLHDDRKPCLFFVRFGLCLPHAHTKRKEAFIFPLFFSCFMLVVGLLVLPFCFLLFVLPCFFYPCSLFPFSLKNRGFIVRIFCIIECFGLFLFSLFFFCLAQQSWLIN